MNKKGFIEFLKQKKKTQRAIKDYTGFVQQYEEYLLKHKRGKKDLHDFEKWAEENHLKVNRFLWGIKEYYHFVQDI